MESCITRTEKIPFYRNYDIIVAGGGVAGIAAALASSREGKRVLLIEKSCILGGLATIGLINLFVPLCNGRGKQIISGMAEELLKLRPRQRSLQMEKCLIDVLKRLPENAVVKDIDVLFNPGYTVDVLKVLISAYKQRPFRLIWSGTYADGKKADLTHMYGTLRR